MEFEHDDTNNEAMSIFLIAMPTIYCYHVRPDFSCIFESDMVILYNSQHHVIVAKFLFLAPKTRVELPLIFGHPNSEYINANYIRVS